MLTFVVSARRTPQALLRVFVEFHKREIEIERLTARAGKNRSAWRITIAVAVDGETARRMVANLEKDGGGGEGGSVEIRLGAYGLAG